MFKKLAIIFVLGVLVLSVAPAGAPVRLSYVYSDSMEPTLETNDGFLVVPSDGIESGDIVTFWSPDRGSYVTHRVVGKSAAGYVTRGDNNPTTDQAAGYPAVDRADITGEVLTSGGEPIVVPRFGAAVTTLRDFAGLLLAGVGLVLLTRFLSTSTGKRRPRRSVPTVRDVLLPVFVVCVLSGTGLVLVGATGQEFTFVAVESPSDAPQTLTVGEPRSTTMTVNRSASPFTHAVVRTDNMQITGQTRNETSITVTARIPPPETTGAYTTRLRMHNYPAVVPLGVVRQLDRIHPVVPASLTTLVVILPMYLLAHLALDGKTPIRSSRSRLAHRVDEVFK